MTHTRETVKIPSIQDHVYLDVWLYRPEGPPPYPLVVAGHGMTLTKDAGLDVFGKSWAAEVGYASLIFDYRYFGESGGEPRNLVSLESQLQDYESVLRWARQRPELFLNNKIVVMGSALSGLSVARLVLKDSGLAGGMAHSPMLDGYPVVTSLGFNPRLIFWAVIDFIGSMFGLPPILIRAVGSPHEFAFLNTPSSIIGFRLLHSKSMVSFEDVPNVITPRLAIELMQSRPGLFLKNAHCSMLVVLAKEDDMIPAHIGRNIAQSAMGKVNLAEVDGGHFDIMEGGQGFHDNINAQVMFLRSLLEERNR